MNIIVDGKERCTPCTREKITVLSTGMNVFSCSLQKEKEIFFRFTLGAFRSFKSLWVFIIMKNQRIRFKFRNKMLVENMKHCRDSSISCLIFILSCRILFITNIWSLSYILLTVFRVKHKKITVLELYYPSFNFTNLAFTLVYVLGSTNYHC